MESKWEGNRKETGNIVVHWNENGIDWKKIEMHWKETWISGHWKVNGKKLQMNWKQTGHEQILESKTKETGK